MNILFKDEHMLISSQESHMEKVGSHNCLTDSLASKEEEDEIESMVVNVVKASEYFLGCRSDSCSG
jgi:hypothetical protein